MSMESWIFELATDWIDELGRRAYSMVFEIGRAPTGSSWIDEPTSQIILELGRRAGSTSWVEELGRRA